jgi:acyl dehydratase
MTKPCTGDRTHPVTKVVRVVTAGEIVTYRDVVRCGIAVSGPDEGAPEASPIHAFVLASPAFDQALRVLNSTGMSSSAVADAPEPTARVHLSQEIRLQRLVRPAERVTTGVDVLGARREPRGVRLALRSVLADGAGSPFAELVSGVLLVGATAPDSFGHIPPSPAHGSGTGQAVVVTRQISTEMIRRYAEVSGDDNPIHLDHEAARAAGLPGLIAHGMYVMALVCEEVVDRYASGHPARIRGIAGRFSSPVLPEQPLEISLQPDDDGRIVRFSCKTPQGLALKNGWVEIAVAGTAGGKRPGDG